MPAPTTTTQPPAERVRVSINGEERYVTPEQAAVIMGSDSGSTSDVREVGSTELTARAQHAKIQPMSEGAIGWLVANIGQAESVFTGGISDYALPDVVKQAMDERNTTIGSIAGFVPGLLTGGSEATLGKAALGGLPGLASKLGGSIAGKVAGVGGRVLGNAAEGALLGAGNVNSRVALSSDPVTIESALADVGLGAVLNAGFGMLGRGAERGGSRMAARIADEDAAVAAREVVEQAAPAYGAVRAEMRIVRKQAAEVAANAERAVVAARKALDDVPAVAASSIENAAAANAERIGVIARAEAAAAGGGSTAIPSAVSEAQSAKAAIDKMLARGEVDQAAAAANRLGDEAYAGHRRVGDIAGLGPVPDGGYRVPTLAEHQAQAQAALQAAEQAASQAPKVIPKLPKTVGEFARLQTKTVEGLDAALAADTSGATRGALDNMASELGVTVPEGTSPLAAIHKHVREAALTPGIESRAVKSRRGWLDRAVRGGLRSGVGRAADRAVGGGVKGGIARSVVAGGAGALLGGMGGVFVAAEVTGARAAVMGRVRRAVASIAPRVGRAAQKASPAMTRLLMGQDGKREKGTNQEIALRRFDETARMAVGAPDAAFAAVQHVIPAGADAAAALQHKAIAVANYLVGVMPKDPGTAQAQFKSFWKPSNEQIQKFADQHFAATDPLAAMEYLAEGNINVNMAQSLRQNWPALFEQFKREFIQALPEKGMMPHGQLMAYSVMLGQPLHGLQSAENIAYFQTEVHGPKTEAPEPSQPKTFTPGAPPARSTTGGPSTASMTQAQRLQNR